MQVCLVTPAPGRSRGGNRVTALRWARILRALGHRVAIATEYSGGRFDLLVALHARRSFSSIERWRREHRDRPLIVALTGTDLYGDLPESADARRALEMASFLIVLQPLGIEALPEPARPKARVVYQSVAPIRGPRVFRKDVFEVCVLGHLRPVKDPFRAAAAARLLPPSSRVRIVHVGAALGPEMEAAARAEEASNPRYCWLGGLARSRALRVLARSRVLVLSSRMEGGANVVGEAVAAGVPVLASAIPGSIGLLGAGYPGYFPVEDSAALAALLGRAETDPEFYGTLRARCAALAPRFAPAREADSWRALLRDVAAIAAAAGA